MRRTAFSPQGVAEGNGILGHLFGSKDLSRAVADQAAQATGVGQEVLQQMLPVIASMIMGGLFKQSTNQIRRRRRLGGAGNPLGEIIEQMMRQGGGGMIGGRRSSSRSRSQRQTRSTIRSARCWRACSAAARRSRQTPSARRSAEPVGRQSVRQDLRGDDGRRQASAAEPHRTRAARAPHATRRKAARKTPMTTFSARCSRPAPSSATNTRRASSRSSTSSPRAWIGIGSPKAGLPVQGADAPTETPGAENAAALNLSQPPSSRNASAQSATGHTLI